MLYRGWFLPLLLWEKERRRCWSRRSSDDSPCARCSRTAPGYTQGTGPSLYRSLWVIFLPVTKIQTNVCILRWNSWKAFLVEVSEHKLDSCKTRVFVWFSTLFFRSTKCYSRIDSSFLVSRTVKSASRRAVNTMEQKTRVSCWKNWCPRIPSLPSPLPLYVCVTMRVRPKSPPPPPSLWCCRRWSMVLEKSRFIRNSPLYGPRMRQLMAIQLKLST